MGFLRRLVIFDQAAWLNRPEAKYLAETKAYQLVVAKDIGLPKAIGKRTSIVIIDIKDNDGVEVGIVVDVVNEVIELADSDISAAPSFGAKIRADFIRGMGKIDDKLMILLDVDHVLSINE
jgi:chemotaxis signal transduction protein